MSKLLWQPSEERRKKANLNRLIGMVNRQHSLRLKDYDELYDWSVTNIPDFWASVWDFVPVIASCPYSSVVDDLKKFPGARWFNGARLNFAENLLRYRDDRPALIFKNETSPARRMTYAELYGEVACLARSLRELGIKPGDRVVAYMPNLIETAIAMLAATSIGAVWSSCATDLGAQAALDRLGQVEPSVLFTVDGYFYKGKPFSSLANARQIASGIPSLKKTVVVRYTDASADVSQVPNAIAYDRFLARDRAPVIEFEPMSFNDPAVIMFSSGTTGKPKCIVQSGGGLLINHLLELIVHTDLGREDILFYITTCSWMMWNWQLSALGAGCAIVLYDGNPMYPDNNAVWQLIQDEKVTVFGTSASYINAIKAAGLEPGRSHNLAALRQISQTGSALSAAGFEYVYDSVKKDLHFNSIAGGTDINGCFAIGSPTVPVYAGELQRWGLGKKMSCYDPTGKPLLDQMGELVCESPIPSMPLRFWNDPGDEKYQDAYFRVYPGVWRHGDYVLVNSRTRGITFFGRSDAILKPSGVRIGTAEIYNQVEKIKEIADSVAIGQEWQGDQRVLLFVKMAPGQTLTGDLVYRIKRALRENASPRHVPARIIAVPDIPYTLNMKKVETAITNILQGRPVTNKEALANPASLDYFEKLLPDLQKE